MFNIRGLTLTHGFARDGGTLVPTSVPDPQRLDEKNASTNRGIFTPGEPANTCRPRFAARSSVSLVSGLDISTWARQKRRTLVLMSVPDPSVWAKKMPRRIEAFLFRRTGGITCRSTVFGATFWAACANWFTAALTLVSIASTACLVVLVSCS